MNVKTLRYFFLVALFFTAAGLFYRYIRVRSISSAIIQLSAYQPYSQYELIFDGYSFQRCGLYPVKFFPDSSLYNTLSEKLLAAEASDKIFRQSLGNFEERIWTQKLSPFEFYQTTLAVPDQYAREFYKSNKEYARAFRAVLKHTQWKPMLHGMANLYPIAFIWIYAQLLKR